MGQWIRMSRSKCDLKVVNIYIEDTFGNRYRQCGYMNFFPALSHERNQKQYHPKSQESMILDTRAGTEEVQDEPGTFCCARM